MSHTVISEQNVLCYEYFMAENNNLIEVHKYLEVYHLSYTNLGTDFFDTTEELLNKTFLILYVLDRVCL
jgi:hypothetical protein